MTAVWQFLSRRQGYGGRLSTTDVLSYAYLAMGFLLIFLPVAWIALNSVKSQFQIEKEDLSLLPTEYARVARATVNTPDGRETFIIQGLPEWVLRWKDLSAEERAAQDVLGFLATQSGRDFYALRSHLGQVAPQARAMIDAKGLPDWLYRYTGLIGAAKAQYDVDAVLATLGDEEARLLSEFLALKTYKPNKIVSQVLASGPHPETGEIKFWAVPSVTGRSATVPGRDINDPAAAIVKLPRDSLTAESIVKPAWRNYLEPIKGTAVGINVNIVSCFTNSLLVTVIATMITLLINSMAAFALSKYQFRGQMVMFLVIIATLMVPPTITLVGVFKVISATGLSGSIWGVIIPGAATPAGVFLLRQYMLTIPDELLEAARMDAASEWKVYWRIIMPLALPALAALGILSVIWRWNDLILPMVAIATNKDAYTIQLCLLEFRGEHLSQEHFRLAMTMLSLIPTTLVFVFLQRYITTGIANTGLK